MVHAGGYRSLVVGNAAGSRFIHDALVYGTDAELVAVVVPLLRAGLAAGEWVVIVCAGTTANLLCGRLDGDSRVERLPPRETYARAAKAIAAYGRVVEQALAAGAPRVRLVGEVDAGLDRHGWTEWCRFEAASNVALRRYPLWSVCLYDTRRLPAPVVDAVGQTHPHLMTAAARTRSDRYVPPADLLRRTDPAGPDPLEATAPVLAVEEPGDLSRLRTDLLAALAWAGRTGPVAQDFVFAVSEVTTNALRHGSPPVRVRLWSTADRSVCAVTDAGPGFDDPLAGYAPAHGTDLSHGGMGLWLARQLCDHVSMARTADGFTVRLATAR